MTDSSLEKDRWRWFYYNRNYPLRRALGIEGMACHTICVDPFHDLGGAFCIVRHMQKKGYTLHMLYGPDKNGAAFILGDEQPKFWYEEALPRAICNAAGYALGLWKTGAEAEFDGLPDLDIGDPIDFIFVGQRFRGIVVNMNCLKTECQILLGDGKKVWVALTDIARGVEDG